MSMQVIGTIIEFAGGLGMFLYGMTTMADGLQKSAGGKMKNLLAVLTSNRLLAVLVGALVTAIIQSSSATTVMAVGFVNAGIVNLTQAVGVIMGANIGTTITGWLVSMNEWGAALKPEFFAPMFIAIGAFVIMFVKKQKSKDTGEIIIGFGFLFVGLSFMSGAIKPYSESPIFAEIFATLGQNPILGVLAGAAVTAIIQSSSASVGILQTLAMNGVVGWEAAIFITLGQNIGTCVTALISSAGANKTAKRAAVIHLLFNVIGTIIFGVIMVIVFAVRPGLGSSPINSVQISIFHTIFNVTNTVLLFPFANLLVRLSGVIIKESKTDAEKTSVLVHLDDRILETPSFAVENAVKEVINMGKLTLENVKKSVEALLNSDRTLAKEVDDTEEKIDTYEKEITEYLIKISNLSLTEKQHLLVNNLFYTISNIERVGDHADNLAELALSKDEHGITFSNMAVNELKEISRAALDAFDNAMLARTTENIEYVRNVVKLEDTVDSLEEELREQHILRLSKNECSSETGVIFIDALANLERISDHSLNIANYVRDEID